MKNIIKYKTMSGVKKSCVSLKTDVFDKLNNTSVIPPSNIVFQSSSNKEIQQPKGNKSKTYKAVYDSTKNTHSVA